MNIIRKIVAYILLTSTYSFTYLVALLGNIIPHRQWKPTGLIMVTGTFHNPNWYLSHITPLSLSGVKEVILVVDEPQLPLDKVRFVCPPKWTSKLLSRAGAKAIWMIGAGLRYKPDLYMGYFITPGACSALVAGKLLGRPSCYQMTAGPVEIIGGGFEAMDSVSGLLGRPSKLIEKLALAVAKQFDLIVVRGSRAKEYLEAQNVKGTVAIITGSIKDCIQSLQNNRDIHLVSVGQLIPRKQVDQFITIVDVIKRVIPNVRAAIIGDGPLMADLQAYTEKLGLTDNIEFFGKQKDVEKLLASSKIFILSSKWEGLAISMIEAMAAGTVPVVADVGDLGDLVIDGINGYLVKPNCIDEYTKKVLPLLQDPVLLEKHSLRAIEAAKTNYVIDAISRRWQQNLQDVISEASGLYKQKVMN